MLTTADNLDITKIKVVIWDLDNTFWDGIITEGEIKPNQKNMDLVKELSAHGIVNSICSKNYFDQCKNKLIELGMWEYFVFPSTTDINLINSTHIETVVLLTKVHN